ncbi:MAG: hypothetical protein K2Z80_33575 [Xanthobacteraceae bacterium]|nr:hypothetical protein [Xanthobacteraceae bacterium]
MDTSIHPAASGPLPPFIAGPGETDVLMVVMGIFLVLFALTMGILYFQLHALPDRFAHHKVQYQIVCVLGLLAMFTHIHLFWVAGLLLALIDWPDLGGAFKRIARSTEKIADAGAGEIPPASASVVRLEHGIPAGHTDSHNVRP